jgi:hypothetical protein
MCTLLTRKAVQKCLWKALNDEYEPESPVDDETSLREQSGLGADDEEIGANMYDVVNDAVKAEGCRLTAFGPHDLVGCTTVGDIVTGVLKDIMSH